MKFVAVYLLYTHPLEPHMCVYSIPGENVERARIACRRFSPGK